MLSISKFALPIRGVTASNGGTQITGYVDRQGFNYCTLSVFMTTAAVASNNPSTFKLGESDDTYVTNAADITAFVGDGTGGWTIPSFSTATTTDNVVMMNVDCRARKRYLHIEVVPLTTQTAWAMANLFRAEQMPDTSTEANVIALVNG